MKLKNNPSDLIFSHIAHDLFLKRFDQQSFANLNAATNYTNAHESLVPISAIRGQIFFAVKLKNNPSDLIFSHIANDLFLKRFDQQSFANLNAATNHPNAHESLVPISAIRGQIFFAVKL